MQNIPIDLSTKGYELRQIIGRGGFGAVYRAYQPLLEREVAIKVILPEYANHPNFIRRFETEAQLIAQLEHIHIVPLYDYWREPNGAYLVMRLLRGGSLQESLAKGTLWSVSEIARLMDQLASALDAAHGRGIIHRDIKPPNILLDEENNAYLADFGIAKNLITGQQTVGDDERVGSPAYISPEQVTGQPVSAQSDIYSLGVVLYMMLTGQTPFLDPSTTTVIRRHVTEPLPPLQTIQPNLPIALNSIIWRATSKQPEMRYPDALSMAEDFRRVMSSELGVTLTPARITDSSPTRNLPPASPGKTVIIDLPLEPKNPYKGLRPFQEADAADFFGRKTLVERLLKRLDKSRFLAVIGPSGSGKSSVVKAGMLPMLRRGVILGSQNWFIVQMTPGAQPFAELEAALMSIAIHAPVEKLGNYLRENSGALNSVIKQMLPAQDDEVLLVIDQFEEVFTQNENEIERARFLKCLYQAATDDDSRLRIVITLRADLYDRPLLYADFGGLLRENTEVVLPLNSSEMEDAIVGPAHWLGLRFEPGLVSGIITEVNQQPGALPLLQYALTELFERRDGFVLTRAAYQDSGGVLGALARRADELYESLDAPSQEVARQLFLRMVTLGEGVDDTRRRILREELTHLTGDRRIMQRVIDLFGQYRLLTFDHEPGTRAPTIEVAHEALIRVWGRLRNWLDASRDDLRLHQRLTTMTSEWLNSNYESSFLASGVRLAQFEALEASKNIALSQVEANYLRTSSAARRRAVRRLKVFVAGLIVFSLITLGLALLALDRQAAAISEQQRADLEASVARSRELSITALNGVQRHDLALLLSLEAIKSADTFEARSSLLTSLQAAPYLLTYLHGSNSIRSVAYSPNGRLIASGGKDNALTLWDGRRALGQPMTGHEGWINSIAFGPDDRLLVSGSVDETVRLWDVQNRQPIGEPLSGGGGAVWSLAISPDGREIASGNADGTINLWDAEVRQPIGEPLIGHSDVVYGLAFSPDGQVLASSSGDSAIRLWDVQTGNPIGEPLIGHTNWVMSLAFSPDGSLLASTGLDRTIILWDTRNYEPIGQIDTEHQDYVRKLAFSPDGSRIATGSDDQSVRAWDVVFGEMIGEPMIGHFDAVWGLAFSPDGQTLISGSADGNIAVWDANFRTPFAQTLTGSGDGVLSLAFSPDGTQLASAGGNLAGAGQDHTIRLWNVATAQQEMMLTGHEQSITSIAFSLDGTMLASGSPDQTIRLWDVGEGTPIRTIHNQNAAGYVALAFSPNSQLLASGSDDGSVILWDSVTGMQHGEALVAHNDGILSLAFSPDGKLLASGSQDYSVILWDVGTRKSLGEPLAGHDDEVSSVAFSPDGKTLASASYDRTIILWDVTTGQPLGQPLVGHLDWITGLAFSTDGKYLISGSADNSVMMWDVATRQPLGQPFTGHGDWVTAVAFNPRLQMIASGSQDRTIKLWDVNPVSWENYACQITNRNLSDGEWGQYFHDERYRKTCPTNP
jgi:WD40 repeat protein/serine/threonine protein kinase